MVVFADLAFDVGTADARVGRKRLVHLLVVQLPPDVSRRRELVVQGKEFFLVLRRLGEVEVGSGLHVR